MIVNDFPIVTAGVASVLEPFAARVEVQEFIGDLPAHGLADVLLFDTFGSPDPAARIREVIAASGAVVLAAWPGQHKGLTPRESEVLSLIVSGLSNHDIAHRIYVSINSVKSYVRSAYRKMGVSSRSQAVVWGLEHGFRVEQLRSVDPRG